MEWLRQQLHHPWVHRGLCLALVLAIVLGLCLPALGMKQAQPDDPLGETELAEIQSLHLGSVDQQNLTDGSQTSQTGQSAQIDPNLTEVDGTEPEETQAEATQPDETKPGELEPSETIPKESVPEETTPDEPAPGDGDQGQEDGNEGEDGGDEAELKLAAVMTWYKYGTHPKTIVCYPSDLVYKNLNTAQLTDNKLKYDFSITGEDADKVTIQSVQVKAGDGAFRETEKSDTITIELPEGGGRRDYTFAVTALLEGRDAQGARQEQEILFTYALRCSYALDLELELSWNKNPEGTGQVTCPANQTVAKTIESHELTEDVLAYTPRLTGALAKDARIVGGEYTTASGVSGKLQPEGGSLVLRCPDGLKEETYYLTFTAIRKDEDGNDATVFYRIQLVFVETTDVKLSFVWLERGMVPKELVCQPGSHVSQTVRNNQLSAGAVKYEMALTGQDSQNARILNISYTSEASGGGRLDASGSLPMTLPEGVVSNTYTIKVLVLVKGKQLTYEVRLRYVMDVSLQMTYTVIENGTMTQRTVLCENGKSKTAEAVYDDQLEKGSLTYEMTSVGEDAVEITSVSCFQSGSGRVLTLRDTGELTLLLKDGKTGENTFTVTAVDATGGSYEFKINIPYKHRGENTVHISTNMTNGQVVTNETATNLNVTAWTEDENGNVISYIPANGTDTRLLVELDGEEVKYASSSGVASEYILYPQNPKVGDTNTHILYIYAEDAYGNCGELTLELKGQRNQAGQEKGTATIYVDLSVLGLGVVDSVRYDVLADEPISYSIAKAVLGMDTGEPFGAAEETLGWKGKYTGTLDEGFYLQSLTPGLTATVLDGSSWNQYGNNEEEILRAIDAYFGKGTGLATLWRCIYRNGLNKSGGSNGSYGEFDYTSGSGWLFSLDGTYYPGLSMSAYSLADGDVLTLRYTLAYGWDVGGGTEGYGNTLGYCVTAINGTYDIHHQMERVENPDGSLRYQCHFCGLVEDCAHEHIIYKDLGDDTHIQFCEDCRTTIGDPEPHIWVGEEEAHVCQSCGLAESHSWKEVEGSNTATCTEPGVRTVLCIYCEMVRQEETPAKGHVLNNRWNHTKTEHYQKCSVCKEVIDESRGTHAYVYNEGDDDWYCAVCDAGHDWDYCGNDHLVLQSATCQKLIYHCDQCGLNFTREGTFPEHHNYVDGICSHCGQPAPGSTDPDPTDPTCADPWKRSRYSTSFGRKPNER